MTSVVILNGPARSGKDTAANALLQMLGPDTVAHVKFSEPLKDWVSQIAGKDRELLEADKEEPYFFNNPMSFRDAQIGMYESLSRVFGYDWLGRVFVAKVTELDNPLIVSSDGGRHEDIEPAIQSFGAKNILLIHIIRKGKSFDGDIRQYIHDSRIKTITLLNDDLTSFVNDVADEVLEWVNSK